MAKPPIGIKELQLVMVCAECRCPLVTRRCAAVIAGLQTLPLSCGNRVTHLKLACGAWGSVCCILLKVRASSEKNTVLGAAVLVNVPSHRNRSAKKGISHGHSFFLGLRNSSVPCSPACGKGPINW